MRRWALGAIGLFILVLYFGGQNKKPLDIDLPTINVSIAPDLPKSSELKTKPESLDIEIPEETKPPAAFEIRYITGNRVALRSSPSKEGQILDRLNTGKSVELIEKGSEWSKVRDTLTQREGYIANYLLGLNPKENEAKPKRVIQAPIVKKKAIKDNGAIIALIIEGSISSYSGNCPCPYNTDKGGRRCGKRSAYSRPGGASPICFKEDVTPQMIEQYLARN